MSHKGEIWVWGEGLISEVFLDKSSILQWGGSERVERLGRQGGKTSRKRELAGVTKQKPRTFQLGFSNTIFPNRVEGMEEKWWGLYGTSGGSGFIHSLC